MTRLSLWLARGLAATFLFVLNTYAISAIALAQDGAANPPSRYAPAAGAKPVTKTQPPASSRPVYGPAAPKSSGAPPQRAIRQAADEQPLEQPARTNRPQQQPTGPDAAPQAEPLPPEWHPLDLQVQQWTDSVLAKWEEKSQGIIRYECKFRSWKYDTVFGPADPNIPKLISEGTIRYANPDKGEFRTEKLQKCKLPLAPGVKPVYEIPKVRNPDSDKDEPEVGDHWVCDGKSIYIYDNVKRIVTQLMLPAAMRDKPITEGPIPFLFGTKAAQINARYWIRPAPEKPATAKDEYWLEAVPKYRADQENFQKVRVIRDFVCGAEGTARTRFELLRCQQCKC